LIAHVSAIFLFLVFEILVIFNDFRAILHSISVLEGGNMVCCKAMATKRTVDNRMTYWFPWKHPMAGRRALEFGVFDDATKVGSSARPYGLRRSIIFPAQNYQSQSIGSALRASAFVSFGAFARKHNPNVGSALRARLSSVANAPGANFPPFRCPPCGLGRAALDSDHAECFYNCRVDDKR